MISKKKKSGFSSDKLIPDIDDNQQYLLQAVDELRAAEGNFILDGHFCLLNAEGKVQRIVYDTFTSLKPEAILLLTEAPEIIAERRQSRDNLQVSVESIKEFQDSEEAYAKDPSQVLISYLEGNYVGIKGVKGLDTDRLLGHHAVGVMWNVEEWTITR